MERKLPNQPPGVVLTRLFPALEFADLFRDHATGKFSHTKLWANVGYLAMVCAFAYQVVVHGLTSDLLFAFGAVFTGSAIASKLISFRYGLPNVPEVK